MPRREAVAESCDSEREGECRRFRGGRDPPRPALHRGRPRPCIRRFSELPRRIGGGILAIGEGISESAESWAAACAPSRQLPTEAFGGCCPRCGQRRERRCWLRKVRNTRKSFLPWQAAEGAREPHDSWQAGALADADAVAQKPIGKRRGGPHHKAIEALVRARASLPPSAATRGHIGSRCVPQPDRVALRQESSPHPAGAQPHQRKACLVVVSRYRGRPGPDGRGGAGPSILRRSAIWPSFGGGLASRADEFMRGLADTPRSSAIRGGGLADKGDHAGRGNTSKGGASDCAV